jgi:hypothetical protein
MMTAPLSVMGIGLPELKSVQGTWWKTLTGQCISRPLWMFCCWAILILVGSPGFLTLTGAANQTTLSQGGALSQLFSGNGGAAAPQGIPLLVNFVLVVVLVIGSLTETKKWASQGSKLIGEWTGKATAFAGGVVMGGSAWGLRKAIGKPANFLSNNATLQDAAANKKGFTGAGARLALYATKKARSGSFDIRNATIPTNAVGDLIEGTVGRTKVGKAIGLNDMNIPSVAIGSPLASITGVGKGGTKGYKETRDESDKRIHDRETSVATELALAKAKKDAVDGAKSTATAAEIYAMEKALAKLNDKQTEALVASNRSLLDSQNFANAISVKQLEALNKSDQFSENEKDRIKTRRFTDINSAMATGTTAAIASVGAKIKGLSDSELEMIDSSHLSNNDFVAQMRSGQIDSVNKSSKFSSTQKANLKSARHVPLTTELTNGAAALAAGNIPDFNTAVTNAKSIVKKLGAKEVSSLDMTTLMTPVMAEAYTPQLLKRMAPEMNPVDIPTLRAYIIAQLPVTNATHSWLLTPDGTSTFS